MRVTFLNLSAQNFMSFEHLSIPLNENGLFLVLGSIRGNQQDSNGAGKSSVFEALTFALFGKTIRNIPIGKVIRTGQEEAKVELKFTIDAREYRIERKRSRNGGSVKLEVLGCRGEDTDRWDGVSGSTMAETDEKIAVLIKCSYDLFVNSIFYGQGLPYRFVQATDSEKKAVMEDILSLGWTVTAKERTNEAFRLYERMAGELRNRVAFIDSELIILRDGENSVQAMIGDRERDILRLTESKTSLESELERLSEPLRRPYNETVNVLDNKERDRASLISRLEGLINERHIAEMENRDALRVVENLTASIKGVASQIEQLVATKSCPLCGTKMVDQRAADIIKGLKIDLGRYKQGKTETLGVVQSKGSRLSGLSIQIYEEQKFLASLTNEIDALKAHSLASHEASIKRERLVGVIEGIRSAEELKSSALVSLMSVVARRKELNRKRIEAEEAVIGATEAMKFLEFWQRGFGNKGLKASALSYIAPVLNTKARHYASQLLGPGCSVVFEIDVRNEKFVVNATDISRGVSYDQFSGGEKRRVDVVVMLALADLISMRNGNTISLQVFDEVCENLDVQGVESLIGLLHEAASERGIFVVSHSSEFSSLFEKFLLVEKDENNVSSARYA